MEKNVDIVALIENNPLIRFNGNYNNELVSTIQEIFTDFEKQMFLAGHYMHLNYGDNDFVVDLDSIWKYIGFARKEYAKKLLEKHFVKDVDFIIQDAQIGSENLISPAGEIKNNHGGDRKSEKIMMTIDTCKKLCMKADTKKANEVMNYYIKLEKVVNKVMEKQVKELRNQLLIKDKIIETKDIDKQKLLEKTLYEQFPINVQCIYLANVDNVSDQGEKLVRVGRTNELERRYRCNRQKNI